MQERKERLIKEAYFNPVTNLPNKKNIKFVFDEQIDRTLRHNQSFLILAIKMNNYHQLKNQSTELVNEFMYEASNIIIKSTRNEDLVAHIYDDIFIILFNEYLEEDNSHIVIERLQKGFSENPVDIDASYDVSMGLTKYPNDGTDSETLIEKAIAKAESKQF
ncbi:GGDEF domain-containing protein [Sulfurimonas marina]|nr:diguanylate cyclase [Sulfurimonas marina]